MLLVLFSFLIHINIRQHSSHLYKTSLLLICFIVHTYKLLLCHGIIFTFYLIFADLKPLLTSEIVTELVMTNIDHLPRKMPKTFYNSYTPIARAGTEAQVINSFFT